MWICSNCGRREPSLNASDRVHCPCTKDGSVQYVAQVYENAWLPLHRYGPMHRDDWNIDDAKKWFLEWLKTVPRSCGCRKEWRALLDDFPVDYASAEAFFTWSWFAHDQVSERIGNPRLSFQEAWEMWWLSV